MGVSYRFYNVTLNHLSTNSNHAKLNSMDGEIIIAAFQKAIKDNEWDDNHIIRAYPEFETLEYDNGTVIYNVDSPDEESDGDNISNDDYLSDSGYNSSDSENEFMIRSPKVDNSLNFKSVLISAIQNNDVTN